MPLRFSLRTRAVLLPFLLAAATPALAQGGDVSKGEDLAKANCASCHELTARRGRDVEGRYVPSLPEIANTPHYSLIRLRRIIAVPPHSEMPKVSLGNDDINAIATYIQSLRTTTR